MVTDELSPVVRDEILEKACGKNASLEILAGEENRPEIHKSMFLKLDETVRPPLILIEQPSHAYFAELIASHQEFDFCFNHGGQRLSFTSHIVKRALYRLNEQAVVPAFCIEYPQTLVRNQRRNFYRYKFPLLSAPQVQVAPEHEGHRDNKYRWEVSISDISGGGLCFVIPKSELDENLEVGKNVDLKFTLEFPTGTPTEIEYALVGEIRTMFYSTDHHKSEVICGISFLGLDSLRMIPLADSIFRFVAVMQREVRKRGGEL
jgi:c-di-GMP-binding flagellar brake protein YcgR